MTQPLKRHMNQRAIVGLEGDASSRRIMIAKSVLRANPRSIGPRNATQTGGLWPRSDRGLWVATRYARNRPLASPRRPSHARAREQNMDTFDPIPEDRFSFGLWTVGNPG